MFDQNYYNYLASTNPAAATQYLAQFQQQASATPPAPAAPAIPQYAAQPQAAAPIQGGVLAPPVPELARGTLEDFDDQRVGGGGPSVTKFYQGRQQGSWVHVRVTRDLNNTDVRQQTDYVTKQPKTFKDGKPKFDLWVPVTIVASSDPAGQLAVFAEGTGMMYLKPDGGDGLKSQVQRALATVGNPDGLRTGKLVETEFVISSAGEKPNPGRAATKLYQVQAFAPAGVPANPTPAPAAPVTAVPVTPAPVLAAPVAPAAPVMPTAPAAPAAPMVPAPAAVVPTPGAPAAPQVTAGGETKEQLLARLSGKAA